MKPNINLIFILGAGLILGLSACKPEAPVGEEEITTVRLVFPGNEIFTWKEGSQPDTIILASNTTYAVEAEFLNENESPAEDITEEIQEESDEHLVCYEVLGNATLSISRTDSDGTYELGLATQWEAGMVSEGEVSVTLRHQPGVKDGTCDPGDSDVEITFPVSIR